jgi:hypothetical protein
MAFSSASREAGLLPLDGAGAPLAGAALAAAAFALPPACAQTALDHPATLVVMRARTTMTRRIAPSFRE